MGLSKFAECMPEDYGYVILTATASHFANMWMAINVGKARKKFGIEYPDMYSKDSKEFNCIQRAHQNALENHGSFMFYLMIGGLQYPRIAAASGLIYIAGRIAYAKGYYTGEPEKRRWGGFAYIGLLSLLGSTISFAAHQLRWV